MNKKNVLVFSLVIFTFAFCILDLVHASPSTVYWTPCTTFVQPFLKGHITYDTYFRTNNILPIDYGYTMGILPFKKVQMELGYDGFVPVTTPEEQHYFNAKIGTPEGELLPVGVSAGIFSKGFKTGVTDYDIWHFEVGKTFAWGNMCVGAYTGNKKLLVNETGDPDNSGFMLAYTSPQWKKFVFCFDYMSGKNSFSAWGPGLGIYFADNVCLLTGPVFPLAKTFSGGDSMMWTLQLDIDFEFGQLIK